MDVASHLFWLSCAFGSAAFAAIAACSPARAALPAAVAAVIADAAWVVSLRRAGMPLVFALLVAATPALVSAYFAARRPSFAPPAMRDEALLLALALGIVAAVLPGLNEGWRSASALNAGQEAASGALPAWMVGLVGGLLGAGGVYTWWRRA